MSGILSDHAKELAAEYRGLIQRLIDNGLDPLDALVAVRVVDETCRYCWNADKGCQCWNDE